MSETIIFLTKSDMLLRSKWVSHIFLGPGKKKKREKVLVSAQYRVMNAAYAVHAHLRFDH